LIFASEFLFFLDVSQRKNPICCFFSDTGRKKKNGMWNVERQSKGSGGGFSDFQDFYLASSKLPHSLSLLTRWLGP